MNRREFLSSGGGATLSATLPWRGWVQSAEPLLEHRLPLKPWKLSSDYGTAEAVPFHKDCVLTQTLKPVGTL